MELALRGTEWIARQWEDARLDANEGGTGGVASHSAVSAPRSALRRGSASALSSLPWMHQAVAAAESRLQVLRL